MLKNALFLAIRVVSVAAVLLTGALAVPLLEAQPLSQAPAWQRDAAPQMSFEVVSVKASKSNRPAAAVFPLGPGDAYAATGGLFSATNQPLIAYVRFAFKLGQGDLLGLPAWVYDDRFDVEARASESNPTKDQMRLMMQSLLADRFKLTAHHGVKQGRVYAMVLWRPPKTGPQLQQDEACSPSGPQAPASSSPSPSALAKSKWLPEVPCGNIGPYPTIVPGQGRLVGRGVTTDRIAGLLKNPFTGLDRPVIDRTGLKGTFDFSVAWSMLPDPIQQSSSQDDAGPSFQEALKEQLGLKLEPQTGPVDVIVVDHVEQPSEN